MHKSFLSQLKIIVSIYILLMCGLCFAGNTKIATGIVDGVVSAGAFSFQMHDETLIILEDGALKGTGMVTFKDGNPSDDVTLTLGFDCGNITGNNQAISRWHVVNNSNPASPLGLPVGTKGMSNAFKNANYVNVNPSPTPAGVKPCSKDDLAATFANAPVQQITLTSGKYHFFEGAN